MKWAPPNSMYSSYLPEVRSVPWAQYICISAEISRRRVVPQLSLTSASSYFEFGQAVMDTCQTLVNTSVAGFNEAACTNVGRALRLTGITKFTITDLTSSTSVPKYTYLPLVASVRSYAGATITLQPQHDGRVDFLSEHQHQLFTRPLLMIVAAKNNLLRIVFGKTKQFNIIIPPNPVCG